ncbi:response regulator [bacterium]|nr:response regulator [bacterium]MCI0601634.1 response regulator [bacterium]
MKILIVDDVAANRRLLRAILENQSIDVMEAEDGIAALEKLAQTRFDVVIADIQMPRLDGYQLCYRVRKDPKLNTIPFIIYTSTYISAGDQKLALDLGADKFITRPSSAQIILDAVSELLTDSKYRKPRPNPPAELEAMKRYTEQVVAKLEQKNLQLGEVKEKLLEQIDTTRAAQDRLKHVLFMSPSIIYVLRAEKGSFVPVWISDNIRRVFGYSPKDALSPEWWNERVHPEDRLRNSGQPLKDQTHSTREYRIRHKNGTYRWILDEQRIIHDVTLHKTEIIGSWLDITETKLAEEAIRQSEERYGRLVEESEQAIFLTTHDGKFVDFNPATSKLFGYSREELFKVIIDQDIYFDQEEGTRYLQVLMEHGHARDYELAVRTKKGEKRIILVNSTVDRDLHGNISTFRTIALDITDRRLVEEQMAVQLAVTRVLAESASIDEAITRILQAICETLHWDFGAFWAVDAKAKVLHCSNLWHTQRVSLEEYAGNLHEFTFEFGKGLPGQVWATGRPVHVEEQEIWKEPLRERIIERAGFKSAFYSPIKNEREVMGVMEFFSVTSQTLELGLLDMAGSLGSQIGQYLERKKVEQAKTELEKRLLQSQKIEAIGQLAGGVAHDFNNVLMAVMSYGALIQMNVTESHPVKNYSLEIQKAAERGANLTRQLLAFSRKQVLTPKTLDLNHAISRMEDMLQRLIGEHIEFKSIYAPDLGLVQADPGQIEQVLMNLTVNARDAMPHGGKLVIETKNLEIDEASSSTYLDLTPGRYVMFSVTDTGIGMDKSTQARIFEPFFTTKEEEKGTGLGLATVYGIVKQSEGHIEVYSFPGVGTTFKIYLPQIKEETKDEPIRRQEPKKMGGKGEVILLVDDNASVRSAVASYLGSMGYRVLVAGNGRQALKIASSAPAIDLLVTDMVMPEMSGIQLVEELQKTQQDLKILYMSGFSEEVMKNHSGLRAGSIFVQKPTSMQSLLISIRELLTK